MEDDVREAQDNLLKAKISQAALSNEGRNENFDLKIGDRVMLCTKNRRNKYISKGDNRVAKFMPRFDGPFRILEINDEGSTVTLDLPTSSNIYPTFSMSEIKPYNENDATLFPSCEFSKPGPIDMSEGEQEYFVEKIINERCKGCGVQYLVQWLGYGPEEDLWLPGLALKDNAALDNWLAGKGRG